MKSLTFLATCALTLGACSGCKSGVPVPGFMSGWFAKKDATSMAPSDSVSKAMTPWTDKKEPNAIQKIGTSISESSVARTVSGTFSKASQKMSDAVHPRPLELPDNLSMSKPAKPSADVYVSVARIQEKHGNGDEAIEKYKRALEIDPDHLAALVGLGRAYDRQNRLDDAMKCYLHAVEKHPHEAGAMNDLALCFARQGKYADSMETLRLAIREQPDKVLYRNNLATVMVEIDQVDEAVAQLENVHGRPVACYNVGVLLARRGRMSAAMEQFRLASTADPSFEEARQWLVALDPKKPEQVASLPPASGPMVGNDDVAVDAMNPIARAVPASAESAADPAALESETPASGDPSYYAPSPLPPAAQDESEIPADGRLDAPTTGEPIPAGPSTSSPMQGEAMMQSDEPRLVNQPKTPGKSRFDYPPTPL
ncbi:MAG TPA: tetratricopeptide repeat protein, partial [Pirellulales bacterium]|nr:tetratricopeptide repeat protein [Pirellulales bacterium]